jgi:hypothetical protein
MLDILKPRVEELKTIIDSKAGYFMAMRDTYRKYNGTYKCNEEVHLDGLLELNENLLQKVTDNINIIKYGGKLQ